MDSKSIDRSSGILYTFLAFGARVIHQSAASRRTPVGNHAHCNGWHLGRPFVSPGPGTSGRGNRMDVSAQIERDHYLPLALRAGRVCRMDVSTQIERDHPIDLKRVVTNPD